MIPFVAAQDTPTAPPQTSDDSVPSSIEPYQPQSTPVEGNQSAPDAGDLAPIYEHNGEPAFGIPANGTDNELSGEEALLYADATVAGADQDNTWTTVAVGAVLAISICAIGVLCFTKRSKA
jgi:hypothetical protein